MTDLEQRLRDELHRIGERADPGSIRPLRVPPARGRSRLARWLAPVAAVAAVTGVITGVSLAGHAPERSSPRLTAPPPEPTAPPPEWTAPPPEPAAPDVMPPYYVVIQEGPAYPLATTAVVRSSRTGAVLASVRLPQLQPAVARAISAAADNRTFLITDGNDLFLLRLAADGRSVRLTKLAITVASATRTAGHTRFAVPSTQALSPDGQTVAFTIQSACNTGSSRMSEFACRDNEIRLVSLNTGATRTWSTGEPWQPEMSVSWDGNDHVLFSWAAFSESGPQPSGYRLLDVAAGGSSLLGAQMLPLPPLPVYRGAAYEQSAFVTPGGGAVILSTFKIVGHKGAMTASIDELSARTGGLVRVLLKASTGPTDLSLLFKNEGCSVLALGPGGVHALVECTTLTQTVFGRVDDGRFTPLPGMPYMGGIAFATAGW